MPKVVASIEARMGASRLPGKVLMDVCGAPAIRRLVDRLRLCRTLDEIVIATTTEAQDDPIVDWAQDYGVAHFRGSEQDVLDRVVQAHKSVQSDIVVEITGDCPLQDPEVIDLGVETYLNNNCDVVNNVWKTSYPQGVEVQVFAWPALDDVAARITDPAVREHVSLYFYENPDKYNLFHMMAPHRLQAPELRFQLDYPEDLEFIRAVYDKLIPEFGATGFGTQDILALLDKEPALKQINAHCIEKSPR